MSDNYYFQFPDGNIYRSSFDPESSISDFINKVKGAIFKDDERPESTVQKIQIFYSGFYLNNDFKFSEIHCSKKSPLKVHIKQTPEAIKAKAEQYEMLKTIGLSRMALLDKEKNEKRTYESTKIKMQVTPEEIQALEEIMPEGLSIEVMILFYLNAYRDINTVKDYFENALSSKD